EPAHYALYGAFAGLPAAWLLRRAAEASWARAAAALAFLCLGFHPRSGIENVLTVVTSASRARAERAAEMKPIPLGGGALVPAVQAEDLAALKSAFDRVMGPGDTFFDFSNEPALYFLLDRRMPVPFLGPEFYESEGAQRRVIALCERERPLVAIARAGNGLDAIDGVANEIRAPIVAGYLKEKYRPFAVVGGREVLIRADRRAR
ncbi:MAG TPA: hypothetical protein VFS34_10430, partial [Thermoanaerobaculia bacterium]|nr:hypothetical protein [Thermoanaerobaculia bacterium]